MSDTTMTVTIPTAAPVEVARSLPGIEAAERRGNGMKLRYDVADTNLGAIEAALADAGFPAAPRGVLGRLKRAWVRFQEGNMDAHAKVVPHCCSKPPK